jgi:hypothetical protein
MDQNTAERTCPKCGSAECAIRSRKTILSSAVTPIFKRALHIVEYIVRWGAGVNVPGSRSELSNESINF